MSLQKKKKDYWTIPLDGVELYPHAAILVLHQTLQIICMHTSFIVHIISKFHFKFKSLVRLGTVNFVLVLMFKKCLFLLKITCKIKMC